MKKEREKAKIIYDGLCYTTPVIEIMKQYIPPALMDKIEFIDVRKTKANKDIKLWDILDNPTPQPINKI